MEKDTYDYGASSSAKLPVIFPEKKDAEEEDTYDYGTPKSSGGVTVSFPNSQQQEDAYGYNKPVEATGNVPIGVTPIEDTSTGGVGSIGVPRADPVSDPLSAEMQDNIEEVDVVGSRRAKITAFTERKEVLEEQAEEAGYTDTDKYITEKLGPIMVETFKEEESPILSKMFEVAPEWSYKALMGLNDVIQTGASNTLDFLEERLEDLEDASPKTYDLLNAAVAGGRYAKSKSAAELANTIGDVAGVALEFSETTPFVGAIAPIKTGAMRAYKKAADNVITLEKIDAIDTRRANFEGAKLATIEASETARVLANSRATSDAGVKVTEDMIDAFETKINVNRSEGTELVIHKLDSKGNKILDDDAARKAGDILAEETYTAQKGTVRDFLEGDLSVGAGEYSFLDMGSGEFAHLATGTDTIMKPILNSNKFNAIIAAATDLKDKNPKAFSKPKYITKTDRKGVPVLDKNGNQKKIRDPNQISVIDELYQLTVSKDMMAGEELVDMLNDYGLSFEDYVLTVVGSGSEAGKVLQKLSVIRRSRPQSELADSQQKALLDAQGGFRNALMRVEGVRRGLLVSQLATASRNLTSAAIRTPLEGLGNVMDEALYQSTKGNYGRAVASLSPVKLKRIEAGKGIKGYVPLATSENWKNSFRHMKYMFSRPDIAKGYTDLILGQPQLAKQFDMMYNNLNEIQKSTGRGGGGKLDTVLTGLEDATDLLNTPNRWQEFLIRRGQFFGELERLTKREYGIDLIDTLQDGKLRDLLNDAGGFKPEGKPSFLDLVDQSTKKALDVTYAKQPDIPVFRSITSFITRNGLTVVMPFPRFMFNSMELMGQYAGGVSLPLGRKLASLVTLGKVGKGPLTPKDRQRISRNLIGMAMVGAAYQYRTSDEAPADYKQFGLDENVEMDTTPQFPLRQYLWMGEAAKRIKEGTYLAWFDGKEFTETFSGTNFRQGSSNAILEEVSAIAAGGTDLTKGETVGKTLGGAVGNYLATWVAPFSQVIEAQRFGLSAVGTRGLGYKEGGSDPSLDFSSSFMAAAKKPFKKYMTTPEEEAELPSRLTMFGGSKSRVSPLSRVALGFNLSTRDKPAGEYLERLGFQDWKLGSTSRVPSIRNAENSYLTDMMPLIVDKIKEREETLRDEYRRKDPDSVLVKEYTEESFVTTSLRPLVQKQFDAKKKGIIKKAGLAGASPYVRAIMEYRRLKPDYRQQASLEFVDTFGYTPDPTSKEDIQKLVVIGRILQKN